ncbi:putative Flp pilus-assembly TadE/G-like protein [Palleronia aestuarii]|uniref:Putative Flp pilus-assembly TadE/G-like protein n=1 Tax=Palleronia aestuarii TaxID=568105 RepID=A0A2W7MZY4_9RHOB|nr:Tad domain-containing protein [Palleronia aestuarii]PZX13725.1 putative Flp pilus-assembly TadE/G-like protein [Palleronia aestuarii]
MRTNLLTRLRVKLASRKAGIGSEDGSLTVFALFLFAAMVLVGGLAVDLMRFETGRIRLQAVLDRAVLAAADLQQLRTPEDIVREYLAMSGIEAGNVAIDVDEIYARREVGATAGESETDLVRRIVTANMPYSIGTIFLPMVDLNFFNSTIWSQAEEEGDKIEISLVLDLSGSMNDNNRLGNLKVAAKQFVDTVLRDAPTRDLVSISIVPFSGQVSTTPTIVSLLNFSTEHDYTNCVDFDDSAFTKTSITAIEPLKRAAYFDPYSGTDLGVVDVVCRRRTDQSRWIFPFSSDPDRLKSYIDAFSANGGTSINIGVKWGAWLLDPSSMRLADAEIAAGRINPKLGGRPYQYRSDGVRKILVVMSDGENWQRVEMKRDYMTATSEVWRDPDDGRLSVRYWDAYYGRYRWHASATNTRSNAPIDNDGNPTNGIGDPVRLTYPDLWNQTNVQRHYLLQYNANSNSGDWYWRVLRDVPATDADRQLDTICTAAKNQEVEIYAIGFEATDHGNQTLKGCATDEPHFFDVDGIEISDAFAAIARNVRPLRLSR